MKKTLFLIPVLLGLMVSCGKDDDNGSSSTSGGGVSSYHMDYIMKVNDTILHYYDVTVNYRDNNSRTLSESVTSRQWSKHFDSWGDSLVMQVSYSLKPGVDTSYSNTQWLQIQGDTSRITLGFKYHASAYEMKGGVRTTHVGEKEGFFTERDDQIQVNKRHWQMVTDYLNRHGKYYADPIKK